MNQLLEGWSKEVSPRQVKESYILAKRMRDGPFGLEEFRARFDSEALVVAGLSSHSIDDLITDAERRCRIEAGRWELSLVELAACLVWPSGERRGPIDQAAQQLAHGDGSKLRISSIPKIAHITLLLLPIIVLRRNDNPFRFNIEDGVHRAAAYYQAGLRLVPALIGTIPADMNHDWPWPG